MRTFDPFRVICLNCAFWCGSFNSFAKVDDPSFSPNRGFFSTATNVVISSDTEGSFISYTTDGTTPIASGGQASPVSVTITQSTPLRAIAYLPSGSDIPSDIDTHTYILLNAPAKWDGTTYTTSTAYPPDVVISLNHLPAVFVSMSSDDFATVRDSGTGGIGSSGGNEQFERACSIELYYPDHPRFKNFRGFQINAGLRPHSWVTTKRAFRVYFKRSYGEGKLEYPLFESAPWGSDSATEVFDKFVLRHHSNDGWEGRWGASSDALYLRDQFARAVQYDMDGIGSHSIWVHLFVNGGYYGLYNPSERPDADHQAAYHGGDGDDYLGFNHGGVINDGADETIYNAAWNPDDLSIPAHYTAYQQVTDITQFSDYLISSFYCTTHSHDWPVNGDQPQNFYGGNRNNPPRGVQYFTWDYEAALVWDAEVHDKFKQSSTDKDQVFIKSWFALIENPDFLRLFADRTYRHLYHHGALSKEISTDRLRAMSDYVRPALIAEKWQWGDKGQDHWDSRLATAFARINNNATSLIGSMRTENYYPAIDPPEFRINGIATDRRRMEVAIGTTVTLNNPNNSGSIFYTTDGSDPVTHGLPASSITINSPTTLKARVQATGVWSALHETTFTVTQDFSALKFTEIMYNPQDEPLATGLPINAIVGDAGGDDFGRARIELAATPPDTLSRGDKLVITGAANAANNGRHKIHYLIGNDVYLANTLTDEPSATATAAYEYDGDRYDFIELKNTGPATLDLSGIQFTRGVRFRFPNGFRLATGKHAVIVNQPWRFVERYPTVDPDGEFLGGLDNKGEQVELGYSSGVRHLITALNTSTNGVSTIAFDNLPTGIEPGDRVLVTMASNVVNNGSYEIFAVNGDVIVVDADFSNEGAGAKATLFETITSIRYNDRNPWPLSADGIGYSLVTTEANPAGQQDAANLWRASASIGGSPGADDPEPGSRPGILINEALTHTDWPQVDTIELYNPTTNAVNLTGWWLTDDRKAPQKYMINDRTIPTNEAIVMYEDNDADPNNNGLLPPDFFGSAFSLSSHGEQVYLFSPDLSYSHGFPFEGAANGHSFGRYVTSQGDEHFVAQHFLSLGEPNTGPKIGPVVITEIHYHPPDGGHEFVELKNISANTVNLYASTNQWRMNGIGFTFPPGISMIPGEAILLVRDTITPLAFADQYNVPAGTRIFSYDGRLDNGGETLTLYAPDLPDTKGVAEIVIDRVKYNDNLPWPINADGGGDSLDRITPANYGNDVINWRPGPPTPGLVEPPTAPLIAVSPGGFNLTSQEEDSPAAQVVEIWNGGIGVLDYVLSETNSWLTITPITGNSTDNSDRENHTLSFDTSMLSVGLHTATVTITAAGAGNSPAQLVVRVEITERDRIPPSIQSVEAINGTTIEVVFNESLEPASAGNPANYTLDQDATVVAAFLEVDQRTVTLTTSTLSGSTTYALSINNVNDVSGNEMASVSIPFEYADILVPDGLIAYWPMEEGAGSTMADESGNDHIATITGASWTGSGRFGNAVRFDGNSDTRVNAGTFSVPGTALTICGWFNADDFGTGDARIISKAVDHFVPDHWFMLSTVTSGADAFLRARLKTNGTTDTLIATTGAFYAGDWVFAGLVYDGNTLKLFKDAIEVASMNKSGSMDVDQTVPIWIGNNPGPHPKPFDGIIDDVRIYDRALSPTELETLYTATQPSTSIVHIIADDPTASEGGDAGQVTISRTSFLSSAIHVGFAVSGTATSSSDYPALGSAVLIPAGVTSVTLPIHPIDDSDTEGTEDVKITLLPGTGYVLGDPIQANVTITDNDFSTGWFDTNRPFRVLFTANGNGYTRINKPVETTMDLAALLIDIGEQGTVNTDSIRVYETNLAGDLVDPDVAFQFDSTLDAQGNLIWIMGGTTDSNQTRYFHTYFSTDPSHSSVSQTDQVAVTDNITHESDLSYRITTPICTYYYHKSGAGFASLEDIDGNDWIGYHPTGGSQGSYRGIPNLQYFHPGLTTCTSVIEHDGPVKTTIYSEKTDGLWAGRWEIFPYYARLTITKADGSYWFLYEGTPGGAITHGSDTVTRSNGDTTPITESWTGDLTNPQNEEWLYFSDTAINRSILFAHHENDNHVDSYYQMGGEEGMTVFGFGRDGLNTYMTETNNVFTLALVDEQELIPTRELLYSAYKDVLVQANPVEVYGDQDGDFMPDQWEVDYFGRVDHPGGLANLDNDGDHMTNYEESIAGTNPLQSDSALTITQTMDPITSQQVIRWRSTAGKTYALWCTNDMSSPFSSLIAQAIPATPPENSYVLPVATEAKRYYLVEVEK